MDIATPHMFSFLFDKDEKRIFRVLKAPVYLLILPFMSIFLSFVVAHFRRQYKRLPALSEEYQYERLSFFHQQAKSFMTVLYDLNYKTANPILRPLAMQLRALYYYSLLCHRRLEAKKKFEEKVVPELREAIVELGQILKGERKALTHEEFMAELEADAD